MSDVVQGLAILMLTGFWVSATLLWRGRAQRYEATLKRVEKILNDYPDVGVDHALNHIRVALECR